MLHTTPFLLFDGTCAQAMTFYQEVFGGDLTLSRLGDTPMKNNFPSDNYGRIIYAQLKNGGIDISATDWMAAPVLEPLHGNMFAIYLTGNSYNELKTIFDKLSEGADKDKRTFMEPREMPFGVYGQLTDRYGVAWIFKGNSE